MVEFHSLWNLPTAKRIARALEEFEPFWYEDPIKADNIDALADYAASTFVPTTISETLRHPLVIPGGYASQRGWGGDVGSLLVRRHLRGEKDRRHGGVVPAAGGPARSALARWCWSPRHHLSLNATNALIQESVRAYYTGWYKELVTDLPTIENGYMDLPAKPGLGTELRPDLRDRPDAHVRASTL